MLREWSKSTGGGGGTEQRGRGSSIFEPLVRGGSFCFITGINTHLTLSTTEVTSSSSIRRKCFEPWLVYSSDDNFMYCKICTKAKTSNGMSKELLGRNFQTTALFSHAGVEEYQMANVCLYAICPQGYGTHVHGSKTHTLGPGTRSLLAVRVSGLTTAFL